MCLIKKIKKTTESVKKIQTAADKRAASLISIKPKIIETKLKTNKGTLYNQTVLSQLKTMARERKR